MVEEDSDSRKLSPNLHTTYERPSLTNVIKLLTVETHTGIVFVIMHP